MVCEHNFEKVWQQAGRQLGRSLYVQIQSKRPDICKVGLHTHIRGVTPRHILILLIFQRPGVLISELLGSNIWWSFNANPAKLCTCV